MRSAFAVLVITAALVLAPTVAQADFPEQPGDHVASACEKIVNQGVQRAFGTQGGVDDGKAPAATETRIDELYFDACLE